MCREARIWRWGFERGKAMADTPSPLLEFLFFHKAIRAELAKLIAEAMDLEKAAKPHIRALSDRLQSLHMVYTLHTNAEDEVILPSLDGRVKNVAQTYSLEHEEESKLFDQMLQLLNSLLERKENAPMMLRRELISCTEAIQTTLCQHMSKEEEQVYPLLMQHFSFEEQTALVWQVLCSIPVNLLEQLLPWIASSLSEDERKKMVVGMCKIVPREELLQQAISTWLGRAEVFGHCVEIPKARSRNVSLQHYDDERNFSRTFGGVEGTDTVGTEADSEESVKCKKGHKRPYEFSQGFNEPRRRKKIDPLIKPPINNLLLWHNAIRKDLKEIAKKAKKLHSSAQLNLSTLNHRLQFMEEVCIFHSVAEDEVIFPTVSHLAKKEVAFVSECAAYRRHFDALRQCLEGILSAGDGAEMPDLFRKLSDQADLIAENVHRHLLYAESLVLPLAREHCSYEIQQKLLYESLKVMPLKVLERFFPWLMASLNDEEHKSMLQNLHMQAPVDDTALLALLSRWACKGRLPIATDSGDLRCVSAKRDEEGCPAKKMKSMEINSTLSCVTDVSGFCCDVEVESTYSSDTRRAEPPKKYIACSNFHANLIKKSFCIYSLDPSSSANPGSHARLGGNSNPKPPFVVASKPIDTIFQFHKAISKDLEYLDMESVKLWDCDRGFLTQFMGRFQLLRGLYRAHSTAEDDVVFPALESKEALHNVSHSYTIDHKQEEELFVDIASALTELSLLHGIRGGEDEAYFSETTIFHKQQLASKLRGMCKAMRIALEQHIAREEFELWPLFDSHFSVEEQDKIVGRIIGTTGAEVLQAMLPWVTTALPQDQQGSLMDAWRHVTRNTMFDKWVCAWWKDSPIGSSSSSSSSSLLPKEEEFPESGSAKCLQMVVDYLSTSASKLNRENTNGSINNFTNTDIVARSLSTSELPDHWVEHSSVGLKESGVCGSKYSNDEGIHPCVPSPSAEDVAGEREPNGSGFKPGWECIFRMNHKELEAAVRKVSSDASLDPRKKAYLMQNLMTCRWIVSQQRQPKATFLRHESDSSEIPGKFRSYRDSDKRIYGCEHYKRNCKIQASCCGALFTCRFCHDEVSDHSMDRQATKQMMCMKCLEIQPAAKYCTNPSCENYCMAKYYCDICKLFDDDDKKEIYHCPFCNLCRVGKGLGVDYFHCMTCNACMYKTLTTHKCREKGLESDCPICNDFLFTSSTPVKSLTCGHFMHSTCFQAYTCNHYTCPICSKSLGDMTPYFEMLDALLASEELPEEYKGKQQDILCNDCEGRSEARFHWLYHKCGECGSYNTRTV